MIKLVPSFLGSTVRQRGRALRLNFLHSLRKARPTNLEMDVKTIVDARIAGKKVVVFSKSYCPFCTKAKRAFEDLLKEGVLTEHDYDVMEIENDPNCESIQNYLSTLTGGRTVPRVFVNGKFLGGGDDTVRMKDNGELKALLS